MVEATQAARIVDSGTSLEVAKVMSGSMAQPLTKAMEKRRSRRLARLWGWGGVQWRVNIRPITMKRLSHTARGRKE